MRIKNKIIISLVFSSLVMFMGSSSASATESAWQNLNPSLETGLSGTVHNCSPLTVTNGSVAAYPACTITCSSGYTLSGSSCIVSASQNSGGNSNSGGGGPVWSYTPPVATPAVPATQIEGCKPGYLFSTTSGKSCTISATSATSASTKAKAKGEVLGATAFNFTRGLALGSRGDEVTKLQERLISEGFLSGTTTGYFGKLTREAVKKFQAKNGITTTGTVGPKTRAALNK